MSLSPRFLLKYASRDEVELLGRGNGGIIEIRNNIAQYEDKSPLYGFLRYRRRNVIIKYLPEDCSRLIQGAYLCSLASFASTLSSLSLRTSTPLHALPSQHQCSFDSLAARVTVHFTAVCDRFSPYDTTFSIAEAKELKDTKLSSACQLHAASGSTSSSTSSLRRRRLIEIAEEEEEEERERKRQSVVKEEERPRTPTASEPPVKLDVDLAKSPEASRFANDLEPPQFMGVPRPSSPAKSFDEGVPRMSSQSSRTDLYLTTSHPYSKPRVKLGPRPSADLAGRPRSSAGGAAHRPVATVPAGLKSVSKGSKKGRGRSTSQGQDEDGPEPSILEQPEEPFPLLETTEFDTKPSDNDADPAQLQAGSETQAPPVLAPAFKVNLPAPAPAPVKQNTMTPEKARLLKAMKLREKKKTMSLQPTSLDAPSIDIPSAPSTPGIPDQEFELAEDGAEAEGTACANDEHQDDPLASSSIDSGIDVATDHASVDTRTDSQPPTPSASSEIGDSTQASSLSDSTDETVHVKEEEDDVSDNKSETSTPRETVPAVEVSDEATTNGQHDRQSQLTITALDKVEKVAEEPLAAPEDTAEPEAVSVDAPASEALPETAVPEAPAAPSVPETIDVAPAETETVEATAPTPNPTEATAPVAADPVEEEKAPSPQIKIPVSKFSTKDPKSPTGQAIPSIIASPVDVDAWRVKELAPPVPEKDTEPGLGELAEAAAIDPKKRKVPGPIRTDLEDIDKRRSVISILDNDGFMDELQSATVQQATPVTVSKSPPPPLSAKPGGPEGNASPPRYLRTVSNPVRNSFLAPGEAPAAGPVRSASSASFLQKISQQQATDVRPKSANKLGSSISQRIKALEKISGTPGTDAVPKDRPASTFFAVRKANGREPSRSPSVVDRAGSIAGGSPPDSRESSPEALKVMGRGRSGSLVNRLSMFEGGMPPRGRPESVQVTARIVRDPNQPFPKHPEQKGGMSEYGGPLDLKQSPLVVDVQSRVSSRSPARPASIISVRTLEQEIAIQAKQTLLERRLSKQSHDGQKDAPKAEATDGLRPRRRSSLSFVKDYLKDRTESIIGGKSPSTDNLGSYGGQVSPSVSRPPSRGPSLHQAGSLARRLSISSRRSSIDQSAPAVSAPVPTPRAVDVESETEPRSSSGSGDKKSVSGSSGPSSPGQPKSSRATRFMRRLSNSLGTSRKNSAPSISPTVAEEDAAEVEAASRGSTATNSAIHSPPSIVAFMGDVNIQFPDNLLWKRRSICLDSQGFLILSAVQGSAMMPTAMAGKDRHGAMVKRYHMSDFKSPYAPDVELQELPNSVVLDLVDGSGLQIACEDRAGQMSILRSKYLLSLDE